MNNYVSHTWFITQVVRKVNSVAFRNISRTSNIVTGKHIISFLTSADEIQLFFAVQNSDPPALTKV